MADIRVGGGDLQQFGYQGNGHQGEEVNIEPVEQPSQPGSETGFPLVGGKVAKPGGTMSVHVWLKDWKEKFRRNTPDLKCLVADRKGFKITDLKRERAGKEVHGVSIFQNPWSIHGLLAEKNYLHHREIYEKELDWGVRGATRGGLHPYEGV